MEFNENQVFTSLNADKLSPGDKVILANTMANLRDDVERGVNIQTLREVHGEDCLSRFIGKDGWYPLAYLYEKGENCTNCVHREGEGSYIEPRAEKHYRPFKNIDELVKVWVEKTKPYRADTRIPPLIMPLIWVREKGCEKSADLITCYGSKGITVRGKGMYFDTLFTMFEFLDGSPCGVEE